MDNIERKIDVSSSTISPFLKNLFRNHYRITRFFYDLKQYALLFMLISHPAILNEIIKPALEISKNARIDTLIRGTMVLGHNINNSLRTEDVQITQDITFETMLLSLNTLKGLKDSGFLKPSPIQLHGIPLGKCGFDLLLEAKSGTGKTAVFTVIALEKIELKKGLQVVVLAPTREIAAQICDVFRQIGSKHEDLNIEVVMGGLPIQDDIQKFKDDKVNVVVGSPGRLKHLIQDNHINVSAVRLLVLDEADKLMEKSFLTDIKYIHTVLPKQKQVILSSATYPDAIKDTISKFVHDPQHLCPNSNCVLLGVAQRITTVKYNINIVRQTEIRFQELLKIITMKQFKQCLVFCNYQARVGEVHKMLTREKWPAEQLYGQQDQTDRLDALKTLQEYKCRILISTDLAARGIDASNVDLVINFEPPFEWQTYLHRIGRAGRFGSYGIAVTILSEGNEQKKFMSLLDSLDISYLTNFWSDHEKTEIADNKSDSSDNRLSNNIKCNDGAYKELWNIICGDDNKNIDEDKNKIESFDELSNSLQGTEVESFSNLLASFNDVKLSSDELDVQYKNVAIPKKYFNNLNELLTLNGDDSQKYYQNYDAIKNGFEENIQTTNKNYKSCHLNQSVLSGLDCKQDSEKNCDLNSNLIERYKNCDSNNLENTSLSVDEKDKILCKTDISNYNESQLEQLQLPTAFVSSKTRKIEKKYPNRTKTLHQEKQNENLDLKKVCEKRIYSKTKLPNIALKKSEKHSTHIHNSKPHISSQNTEIPSQYKINRSQNLTYEQWYSQLKLRVKYVELAMYIDELSKM